MTVKLSPGVKTVGMRSIVDHIFGPAVNSPSGKRKPIKPSRVGPFYSRQSFLNFRALLEGAKSSGGKLSEIALEYEARIKGMTGNEVMEQMGKLLEVMFAAIKSGLEDRDPIDGEKESNAHKLVSVATRFPCSQAEFVQFARVINKLSKKERLTDKEKSYFERWKFILSDPYVRHIFERKRGETIFEKEEINPDHGYANDLYRELSDWWRDNPSVSGLYIKAAGYAFAVAEWSMRGGKIVAAPSVEACGIIPGVLKAMQECFLYSKEELFTPEHLTEALFTAGLIGLFFNDRARMGIGPASAMAAAAATELLGGDPGDVIHAVAFALEGIRDLPGTPVRNAFGAVVALTAATFATNKYKSYLNPDIVLGTLPERRR